MEAKSLAPPSPLSLYTTKLKPLHTLSSLKNNKIQAKKIILHCKHQDYSSSLYALTLSYAQQGLITKAQDTWNKIIYSSCTPTIELVSQLMEVYAEMGLFKEVINILHDVVTRGMEAEAYSAAISCFGKIGELEMMEEIVKEMSSVDSVTGNAIVRYYSVYGAVSEMEGAYRRLKRSRVLIEEDGIRAVAERYVNEKKFFKLGEFVKNVGLGRRNCGNVLWNLLLLSYGANFKMKSMQREFVRMVDAGFCPDLTTFNIRAIAFSKMGLFWDMNVTIEHMKHEEVFPDLVTFGCVVDLFLDRRLGRNLNFALNKMNVDDSPLVLTDPFVFEVFGTGDFHSSSETLLEYKTPRKVTYRELIKIYLKKKYRSNQIFWNY